MKADSFIFRAISAILVSLSHAVVKNVDVLRLNRLQDGGGGSLTSIM